MTAKIRRIVQVVFIFAFIGFFIWARYPLEEGTPVDVLIRFSPLIPLFDFIDLQRISLTFLPALIIIFLSIFLGRFFCGWICPLGTTIDIFSRLLDSPSNRISIKWQKLRFLKFALLFGLIILAVFSIHIWSYFDPLSIFNRVLTVFLYPMTTYFIENFLIFLSELPFLGDPAYWVFDKYKSIIMPEEQAFYQQVFWITLFFIIILGLEKLSRRFWCRYLCPAGAWLGILSQFRFYERIVGPTCSGCDKCHKECKMNAITEDIVQTNKVECIECFNCSAECPPKAKSILYRWRWKPYHTSIDYDRRRFIKTTAASITALGLMQIGLNDRNKTSRIIRPPGSVEESSFQDRCIRCLECVRICESNGGCLQPDHIHTKFAQLWLPVAEMREGYCEYSCNLCGLVCPTDAILPLSLEEKQKSPMGLAYFDKNLCIPFAQNEDCIVCEEHCPTPDKAIKFEEKEIILPEGTKRIVKYPYVDMKLCIGCGICEYKCPLAGEPGIFVVKENEKRYLDNGLPVRSAETSSYGY
jgi:polyferredoxin